MSTPSSPPHILILGAGIFGLSTALSLLRRPAFSSSHITILDASPELPNPVGSSVDTSRIIRPDYASEPYVRLMREGQKLWREEDWGREGRYVESGVVYVATKGVETGGENYLRSALENVRHLAQLDPGIGGKRGRDGVQELESREEIEKLMGDGVIGAGDWGYVNWGSGWANAEECVRFTIQKLEKEDAGRGRLEIKPGAKVKRLLYSPRNNHVLGALLDSGEEITADFTILATGAWTPTLIDLRGRAVATGQALTYIQLTPTEQETLEKLPAILNETDGTFIIPPRDRLLKVARHGFGYRNPIKVTNPMPGKENEEIEVSVPVVGAGAGVLPREGKEVCRTALKSMVKLGDDGKIGERDWVSCRCCWYCDTPSGDFLITPHPTLPNLLVATGGSGHGFKFLPIIGDKIVDLLSDHLGLVPPTARPTMDPELKHLWRWRDDGEVAAREDMQTECEDGSRGGRRGMIWDEEMAK